MTVRCHGRASDAPSYNSSRLSSSGPRGGSSAFASRARARTIVDSRRWAGCPSSGRNRPKCTSAQALDPHYFASVAPPSERLSWPRVEHGERSVSSKTPDFGRGLRLREHSDSSRGAIFARCSRVAYDSCRCASSGLTRWPGCSSRSSAPRCGARSPPPMRGAGCSAGSSTCARERRWLRRRAMRGRAPELSLARCVPARASAIGCSVHRPPHARDRRMRLSSACRARHARPRRRRLAVRRRGPGPARDESSEPRLMSECA